MNEKQTQNANQTLPLEVNAASSLQSTARMPGSTMPGSAPQDETAQAEAAASEQDLALADVDQETLLALKNLEDKRKRKRRKRNIKIAVVLGVIALIIASFVACSIMAASSVTAVTYTYATAQKQDFKETVQVSGSIQPEQSSVVTPETSGIIEQVQVAEGQQVREGDVLFTLKNDDLDKAIRDAEQQLNEANRTVSDAYDSYNNVVDSYNEAWDRYSENAGKQERDEAAARVAGETAKEETYEKAIAAIPKDATPAQREQLIEEAEEKAEAAYEKAYAAVPITIATPVDEASFDAQLNSANSAITTAEGARDKVQTAYDDAVKNGEKRLVKAPRSGTVLSLTAVTGASVGGATGGTSTATGQLATIADLSTMKVNIEVNEVDVSSLARDQKALITFSALPDVELEGVVTNIASVASGSGDSSGAAGATGGGIVTYKVEVFVEHPDNRLRPGMTANVNIITVDVPDAIVVPPSALTEVDGHTTVQVVTDMTDETNPTLEEREVTVGERSSSQAVVTSGLKEGETVVSGKSSMLSSLSSSSGSAEA